MAVFAWRVEKNMQNVENSLQQQRDIFVVIKVSNTLHSLWHSLSVKNDTSSIE